MPSDRTRELETWLAKIMGAGSAQVNVEMWERYGEQHATDAERAEMRNAVADANREMEQATAVLEALVRKLREEDPLALEAWILAHEEYLDTLIDEYEAKGDEDRLFDARRQREEWGEVRAGERAFINVNHGVETRTELYRKLFGIDPRTFERY
jgi:hypothetical protein